MGVAASKLCSGSNDISDDDQAENKAPMRDKDFKRMRERLESEDTLLDQEDVDFWRKIALDDALPTRELADLFLLVGHKLYAQFLEKPASYEIDNAIWFLRRSIRKTPRSSTGYGPALNSLGCALTARCRAFTKEEGIDEAISLQREALSLHPANESGKATLLSNLANALMTRHGRHNELKDLAEAISLHREALSDHPQGDPGRWLGINNLAHALQTRWESTGEAKDLNEAISLHRNALSLLGSKHQDRVTSLANLANALQVRYERFEKSKDLDEVIMLQREVVSLESSGSQDSGLTLSNLAQALQSRYERYGSLHDLEEAIAFNRKAVYETPKDHTDRPRILNNFAHTLQLRYERFGEVKDLDEATRLHQEALSSLQSGNPDRSLSLNNLAGIMQKRFLRFGDVKDLERQIELHREALLLRPPGHKLRATSLNNLAIALHSRCERFGEMKDLDEATVLHREALSLRPRGHSNRTVSLYNLANALRTRCQQYGVTRDLNEAISLLQEGMSLVPPGHPDRPYALNYLASAKQAQYAKSEDVEDLDEAIRLFREALSLQPQGHPYRAKSLYNLAISLEKRCEIDSDDPSKLQQGSYYQGMVRCAVESVEDASCRAVARLQWAKHWSTVPFADASFRLFMFSQCLLLLQQMLVVNPDLNEQQEKLMSASELQKLAADAASEAIESSEVELAVTLLDHARTVLFGSLHRYRMPVDELRAVNRPLADELQSVGSRLDSLTKSHTAAELPSNATTPDYSLATQKELFDQWTSLVAEVRRISGFADFLSVPVYSRLQEAADRGPVIFLNASERRCDAVIMYPTGPSALVPLQGVSVEELTQIYQELMKIIANGKQRGQEGIVEILKTLWRKVAAPIVNLLISTGIKPGHRVWWCPSGVFSLLPIHAAGLYDDQRRTDVPRLFISSYISTAANLLQMIKREQQDHRIEALSFPMPRYLFVGHTGGSLPQLADELEAIQAVKGLRTTVLLEDGAKPGSTLRQLDRHPWVHFACHGVIRHKLPLESYFQLEGGQLTVQDIINANIQQTEFAFLSACHTPPVRARVLDDNLHLAMGLQYIGYHSVVGTLWESYSEESPEFVKEFYTKLVNLGGRYTDTAKALHAAINACRRRCGKQGFGPERWAMFIHVGA